MLDKFGAFDTDFRNWLLMLEATPQVTGLTPSVHMRIDWLQNFSSKAGVVGEVSQSYRMFLGWVKKNPQDTAMDVDYAPLGGRWLAYLNVLYQMQVDSQTGTNSIDSPHEVKKWLFFMLAAREELLT